MQFNTISAQQDNSWNQYKRFQEHYLYSPSYSSRHSYGHGLETGKYLVAGLDTGKPLLEGFYLNTDLDPVTGMIKQKSALAGHSLYGVLKQIDMRKDMFQDHMYEIDWTICKVHTSLFELEPWMPGNSPIADKRRAALENVVQSLEQEKRREEITTFQDLRLLSQDLNEAISGYLSTNRAQNVFKDVDQ